MPSSSTSWFLQLKLVAPNVICLASCLISHYIFVTVARFFFIYLFVFSAHCVQYLTALKGPCGIVSLWDGN